MTQPNHPANDSTLDTAPDFPSPPPALTRRGVLIGLGVFVFACTFASLSIWARRTRLERTTEVFGPDTITALQLADQVMLLPGVGQDFAPVKLTGTPGLGHLRRALLDQRHYQWDTLQPGKVADVGGKDAVRFTLQWTDPTGQRVPSIKLPLELTEGWVGTPDGKWRVQVTSRVQTALEHQLQTLKNVSQQTADARQAASQDSAAEN